MNKDDLLASRNRSILAHGTKALDEITYKAFAGVTAQICRRVIGKGLWVTLQRHSTFPTMKFVLS